MPPNLGGFGFTHWRDRIFTERLELLQMLFVRGSSMVQNLLKAYIKHHQYQYASSLPVLSPVRTSMKWLKVDDQFLYSYGWLGDLIRWMQKHKLSFVLPNMSTIDGAAAVNDITFTDFAIRQQCSDLVVSQIQRASYEADIYWLSSVINLDGTFNFDAVPSDVNFRSTFKKIAQQAFNTVNLGDHFPGVHLCDVTIALVNDTLRFVEVQDVFESAVLVKELFVKRSTTPQVGSFGNTLILDILHEGEIIEIQGNVAIFLCENESMQIPLDAIQTFTLDSFDVRNPSIVDISELDFIPSNNDFWLSRHALRRLPVKRTLIDSPLYRVPINIKISSHQLELEITRFDSLFNTFTLPPTINSSLFSKYCAKARLDEFNLCRTLGFDPNLWKLCCIHAIPELSNMDFLWSKPDLTPDKIYVVSDGSEKDGIGGMATIIADPVLKKVFAFACQVSPGPGNVTSYRAETYGFWVAAAGPFLLRRHLSSLPIVHWADN
eukprot:CAMPEP_0197323704 /NCGR_PEP_ID=MMETSP0891-20130614/70683_1 /TAXON_ID=44058 ORGANISM="Aureoumbra lagunensis, Strain CCMP1510" /NCGR_SAMPLE_ID=MMETSP0891 /ASSEMBLY_ACC=CAM_ASM_000534 /LENGTH=490 /DNA_ID=CAMNT_0042816407 /DNA_START=2257 /DNA_END=3726 /DNA_ORIENTATION=-